MYRLLFSLVLSTITICFSMVNGQEKSGSYTSYYENGKLKSSENYQNGRKVGICKYYYDNGKLQYEEIYNQYGLADGTFKSYYKNGQLESTYLYKNNKKEGPYKEYYENGALRDEGRYESGERIHYSTQKANEENYNYTNNTSNRITNNASNNRAVEKVHNPDEEMPHFPDGDRGLMNFISRNLKYPTISAENGIQGRVVLSFIVEADGSITNLKVIRSLDSYCDKEAMRIISKMPNWIAGKQNGKNVPIEYTLPVIFRLQGVDTPFIANDDIKTTTTKNVSKPISDIGYYIFGTTKELQEAGIIINGNISPSLNKAVTEGLFIKVDIRKKTEIPLYSKNVKVLSKHQSGSYSLEKDNTGMRVVKISNPDSFWGSSQFLVIEVNHF